jgi:hypothetical protein
VLQKQQKQIQDLITTWFNCSECNMKFSNKETLENHKIKHTGDRPYQCGICGINFGQQFALRAHLKSHNDKEKVVDKPHEIVDCEESIDTTSSIVSSSSYCSNDVCDDEIRNLIDEMIDDVIKRVKIEEPKKSMIAKLLNDVPVSTMRIKPLDFLKNGIISQIKNNVITPVVASSKENNKLPSQDHNSSIIFKSNENSATNDVKEAEVETIENNAEKKDTVAVVEVTVDKPCVFKHGIKSKKVKEIEKKPGLKQCALCSNFFVTVNNLNRHMKLKHAHSVDVGVNDKQTTKNVNIFDFLDPEIVFLF